MGIGWTASSPLHSVVFLKKTSGEPLVFFFVGTRKEGAIIMVLFDDSSVITATRRLHFCAGHRVVNHESKCKHFHGHNYVTYVTASSRALDIVGRVIDFGELKRFYQPWLDENWDHRMILWSEDPLLESFRELDGTGLAVVPFNPTAENMAGFLLELGNKHFSPAYGPGFISRVLVLETENCSVSWGVGPG